MIMTPLVVADQPTGVLSHLPGTFGEAQFNRVVFLEVLDRALARRGRPSMMLAYLDIDGFRQINDTLGHLVGDEQDGFAEVDVLPAVPAPRAPTLAGSAATPLGGAAWRPAR